MRSRSFLAGGLLGGSLLVLGLTLAACSGDDAATPPSPDGGSPDTGTSPDGATQNDGGTPDGDAAGPICSAVPCITQIAAGGIHTCARSDDGVVHCWGSNKTGELGTAAGEDRHSRPMPVANLTAVEIAAGGEDDTTGYTCARHSDGTVSCWGSDSRHQLGRTRGPAETVFPMPAAVEGVSGATAISAGFSHACAAVSGGGVMCWGNNGDGELGREPMDEDGLLAGSVAGLSLPATRPQTAGEHTCVLLNDGTVACFGLNGEYQLGSADAGGSSSLPVVIPGVAAATELVSHGYYACALIGGTGTVTCWGNNENGQLGVGDDARHDAPVQAHLPAGRRALHIGGGDVSVCAALDDDTLYCWGSNDMGQVGVPTASDPSGANILTPVQVKGLPAEPVIQITGGYEHTCALVQSGNVYCWGSNYLGELGRGDSTGDGGIDYAPHYAPAKVVFQ